MDHPMLEGTVQRMGTVETSETSQPFTAAGKLMPMAWLIIGFPLLVGVIFYVFRSKRIHDHPLAIDEYDPEP